MVKGNSVKLYPTSSDRNCLIRNIRTNLGKMINPTLRPNGSHNFVADSAMIKDEEVKPAEFETCSDRMVVEDEARCLRKAMH